MKADVLIRFSVKKNVVQFRGQKQFLYFLQNWRKIYHYLKFFPIQVKIKKKWTFLYKISYNSKGIKKNFCTFSTIITYYHAKFCEKKIQNFVQFRKKEKFSYFFKYFFGEFLVEILDNVLEIPT